LIAGLRTPSRPRVGDFVSTLILSMPPPQSPDRVPSPRETVPITPVEPLIPSPPDIALPNALNTSIDWQAEAKRSAGEAIGESNIREFGRNLATHANEQKSGGASAHEVGEQYRLGDEKIVWVSPHCYIVSDVPPLGMPDVLARSMLTRTVCQDDSKPPGEVFKDLPAYRKFHPQ
jgi:hypothetical protein